MAGRGGGLAEEVGGVEGEEFGKGHARGADDQRGGGAEPAAELREAVGRGFGVGLHLDRGEAFAVAFQIPAARAAKPLRASGGFHFFVRVSVFVQISLAGARGNG